MHINSTNVLTATFRSIRVSLSYERIRCQGTEGRPIIVDFK